MDFVGFLVSIENPIGNPRANSLQKTTGFRSSIHGWFSGSFPINTRPSQKLRQPFKSPRFKKAIFLSQYYPMIIPLDIPLYHSHTLFIIVYKNIQVALKAWSPLETHSHDSHGSTAAHQPSLSNSTNAPHSTMEVTTPSAIEVELWNWGWFGILGIRYIDVYWSSLS